MRAMKDPDQEPSNMVPDLDPLERKQVIGVGLRSDQNQTGPERNFNVHQTEQPTALRADPVTESELLQFSQNSQSEAGHTESEPVSRLVLTRLDLDHLSDDPCCPNFYLFSFHQIFCSEPEPRRETGPGWAIRYLLQVRRLCNQDQPAGPAGSTGSGVLAGGGGASLEDHL